jgi:phosphate transport system substrate-binding protein
MTMRTHVNLRISLVLAYLAAFTLISIRAAGTATEADVAIVVNASNPVNNLTLPELRKIYTGERQYWKANTPIVPLMRSAGARERDVLLRVVFQMTPEQYTHYWVAKVMRAEAANPPAALFSFGMMQEGVRGNPGAIGYVNFNDLRPGVKVLRVDGLLPGEPGYALR